MTSYQQRTMKRFFASRPLYCDIRCNEAFKAENKVLVNKIVDVIQPLSEVTMYDVMSSVNDVTQAGSFRGERAELKTELMTLLPISCDVHNNDVNEGIIPSKSSDKSSTRSSLDDEPSFWIHVSESL